MEGNVIKTTGEAAYCTKSNGVYVNYQNKLYKLKCPYNFNFKFANPDRPVGVLRKQDIQYNEISIGYVRDFDPDTNDFCLAGTITDMGYEGTPFNTNQIVAWAYMDEPVSNFE